MQGIVHVSEEALYQSACFRTRWGEFHVWVSLRLTKALCVSDTVAANSIWYTEILLQPRTATVFLPPTHNESMGQSDERQQDYSLAGDGYIYEPISWLCWSTASHSSKVISQPLRKETGNKHYPILEKQKRFVGTVFFFFFFLLSLS